MIAPLFKITSLTEIYLKQSHYEITTIIKKNYFHFKPYKVYLNRTDTHKTVQTFYYLLFKNSLENHATQK